MSGFKPTCLALLGSFVLAGCETTDSDRLPPMASASQPSEASPPQQSPPALPATLPAPAPVPTAPPIDMGVAGSKPMALAKVVISMEAGAQLGNITAGWLDINYSTLRVNPGDSTAPFVRVGIEELKKARYTVQDDQSTLFSNQAPEKARYQLGADITWMHLDMHAQPGWTKATIGIHGAMNVTWEVFDTRASKVVFSTNTETTCETKVSSDKLGIPLLDLFRGATRQLLAEQSFVDFMRPGDLGDEAPVSSAVLEVAAPADAAGQLSLPADFSRVLDAFVTLEPGQVVGSAFLISPDGYALTAAHVVSGLKTVPARLRSGVVLDAEVVRIDESMDVALLKLPGSSYKALTLSLRSDPPVGTDAYVIGNPALKELDGSVSKGVISGNRVIDGRKFIQTDAAANPGCSGGPVLDKNGAALGLISWKFAGPELQGLAFAVPVGTALDRLNVRLKKPL